MASKVLLIAIFISFNCLANLSVGLYSGTFDPVHRGHVELIEGVLKNSPLDLIIVYPNLDPSHKTPNLPFRDRWTLLKLATEKNPKVLLPPPDLLERLLSESNPNTAILRWAEESYPRANLFRAMGADSFEKFVKYPHAIAEVEDGRFKVLVFERPGSEIQVPNQIRRQTTVVEIGEGFSFSSSKYRKNPLKYEYALPESVAKEVQRSNFYERGPEPGYFEILRRAKLNSCVEVFLR